MNLRTLAFLAALLGAASPAAAGTPGGIAGYVVDAAGRPLAGVEMVLVSPVATRILQADRHGFFADVTLEAGTYFVCRGGPHVQGGAAPVRVFDGEVTRVRIVARSENGSAACESAASAVTRMVDPNQVGDLYRI